MRRRRTGEWRSVRVAERSGGVAGVVKWSGEMEWWSGGVVEWWSGM